MTGVGLAWRPETARLVERRAAFTEVLAEATPTVPPAVRALVDRGVPVVVHGVGLGLGDATPPDPGRLARLARLAAAVRAPVVSEHVAFVRGGGHELGHLFPVPRTRAALAVVADNVRRAQDALPVPLVLENPAALFAWPDDELPLGDWLAEVVAATGAELLLDLSNLWGDVVHHGLDPDALFDRLPLERVRYAHLAGGVVRDGLYHDTHAHPLLDGPLTLLARARARRPDLPVLLERDDRHPPAGELDAELDRIAATAPLAAAPAAPVGPPPGCATGCGPGGAPCLEHVLNYT